MRRDVDVLVYYNKNGSMTPVRIVWDEEHIYDIDAVRHVEKTGIWSNGRESFKYTVAINGKTAHLYYGPDRWYVYPPEG